MRKEGDCFLVKETGDILKYRGRICEDFHKAQYDDYYNPVRIHVNSPFKNHSIVYGEALYEYTLVPCDPNSKALPVLFSHE